MKKTIKLFVISLLFVFIVPIGKMIIDSKEQSGVEAEPEIYEIRLDASNMDSKLPSTPTNITTVRTYTPNRAVPWSYTGVVSSPTAGHIQASNGVFFSFYNQQINSNGIKGIQTVSVEYEMSGTFSIAKMYYGNALAPVSGDAIDFTALGLSNPAVLGTDQLSTYYSSFYLRFRVNSSTAGTTFVIKSLVLTYTCV